MSKTESGNKRIGGYEENPSQDDPREQTLEEMKELIQKNFAIVESIMDYLECTEEITREYIEVALTDILTFDQKQRDYGPRNISDFGEYGVLIRSNDKIARLKNLHQSEDIKPTNESLEDSWKDLSVYGVIARLVRKGVWPS